MSSATAPATFESPAVVSLAWERFWFRLKLSAHILFGALMLIESLYLVVCYVTFDFFGALASSFFSWLRTDAAIAHAAYFPLFVAALLASDLGLASWDKPRGQRLVAVLFAVQVAAGILFFFLPGTGQYFSWPLLFGPHNHTPGIVNTQTYWESIACLIPLAWISAVHIAGSIRARSRKRVFSTARLSSFLSAGLVTAVFYLVAAGMRMAASEQPFSLAASSFSVATHLSIFLAVFLLLEGIRVISNRFPDPGIAQFTFYCVGAWLFLAVVLRKVIFALLAFTSAFANWYAAVFALVVVLFAASCILEAAQRRANASKTELPADWLRSRTSRSLALAAVAVLFLASLKLVPIDWAHVLGSVVALALWVVMLWCCLAMPKSKKNYAPGVLLLLLLFDITGLAGARIAVTRPNTGEMLEEYATFDPSVFVIHTLFKPALQDEKYADWYRFLTDHAMIRPPVAAPDVPLSAKLAPVQGDKPNIFIFVIDALRRDYLSTYNPRVTFTPNIDEFSKDSVVFQNAYSPYAGTALADPALFGGFQQLSKAFPQPLTKENNLQPMLDMDGYDSYVSYNSIVAALYANYPHITRLETDRSDQLDFGPIAQELEADLINRKDRSRPIFAFAQPTNVHTLFLAWHGGKAEVTPHPGFNDRYASAVQRVDRTFGDFIAFLKKRGLYDNSIVVVTADHGESLGEMGRESHVSNVTPEVIRIPLIMHLPQRLKSTMVWKSEEVALLNDFTPTLYYLLGHRPINPDPMVGRPLFTLTEQERKPLSADHFLLMSSYQAVFGILSADQKKLFMTDAVLHRNSYYDLETDPKAYKNRITVETLNHYQPLLRQDLLKLDRFYGVAEQEVSH